MKNHEIGEISPHEFERIFEFSTVEYYYIAEELLESYSKSDHDGLWVLGYLFFAGRIQGIRDERARKRGERK